MKTFHIATRNAKVGDLVTHINDHELHRPLRVIAELAVLDPSDPSQGQGVELESGTLVRHVLYPDQHKKVTVLRTRGYASRNAAVIAARKAAGWTSSGGCYFRPADVVNDVQMWAYTGIKGYDQAAPVFIRRGWIVELGGRWFVNEHKVVA